MAMWMLRYARYWQQQEQQQHLQEQGQRGAALDVAAAERLLVDGDTVGALLALCGRMAPLLLLPYAAQGGVAALLQPLALRRLLCRVTMDPGGAIGTWWHQVVAAAKSAMLAGRWADATTILRAEYDGPWEPAVPVIANLQNFAVRRCRPGVVQKALAGGLRCKAETLCSAFRTRAAGGDAAEVFALCHEQVSGAILEQRFKDLVRGGMDETSAHHQATVAAGWEAAVQLCLSGVPSVPRPPLCDPGLQEQLLLMATQHAGHRTSRIGELVAAAATLAATLADAQLHRQVLRGACFALTMAGEGCNLPRALADAICRLAGNDGGGREG